MPKGRKTFSLLHCEMTIVLILGLIWCEWLTALLLPKIKPIVSSAERCLGENGVHSSTSKLSSEYARQDWIPLQLAKGLILFATVLPFAMT